MQVLLFEIRSLSVKVGGSVAKYGLIYSTFGIEMEKIRTCQRCGAKKSRTTDELDINLSAQIELLINPINATLPLPFVE